MDARTKHCLSTIAEILRKLSSASELQDSQADDLQVATRLIDYLLIEASTAKDAAQKYVGSVQELIPEIEQIITNSSDNIAGLKEYNGDFNMFLADLAGLQRILAETGEPTASKLSRSLQKCDADFAKTIFSEGLARVGNDQTDNSSGAANVKNVDEDALRAFIADQIPGNSDAKIEGTRFLAGGQSKFTLGIDLSGVSTIPKQIVLRGDASDRFSGGDVAYEHRLQQVLHEHGVLVPRPLALEQSGDVFGSPFMLSEMAPGGIIGHMFMLPEPDQKVLADIARHLAEIQKVPVSEFSGWVDNADSATTEKVSAWLELARNDLEQTSVRSATFMSALTWLDENVDINDEAPRVLVHGDYGLNNLLIENSEVRAILDWEFAHIGNSAYDLGYFYFMAEALGSWEFFLDAFANAGGNLPDEAQLNYAVLLAATRLGVQCAQVDSAFNAGHIGAGAARIVSHQYVNDSIVRIDGALQRATE